MYDRSQELFVRARHQELVRAAEHERLAATVRPVRRGMVFVRVADRIYRPALAWLGRRLMAAGHRLQAQRQQAQADEAPMW
jgi:hypothetical protein